MSDKVEVESRFVAVDETAEQVHRLRVWAFNPGNDRNPIALAVRALFADRDKCREIAGDAKKAAAEARDEVKQLRGYLTAYQNRRP